MNNLKNQRIAGKFSTKTFAMHNTTYGDVAMKRIACFKWHDRFKGGR